MRQNPAYLFIARHLAERVTGKPWRKISRGKRRKWIERSSDLVIAMYGAGFTIPQPEDIDAVWTSLQESA